VITLHEANVTTTVTTRTVASLSDVDSSMVKRTSVPLTDQSERRRKAPPPLALMVRLNRSAATSSDEASVASLTSADTSTLLATARRLQRPRRRLPRLRPRRDQRRNQPAKRSPRPVTPLRPQLRAKASDDDELVARRRKRATSS
jgi:hypothetical protein